MKLWPLGLALVIGLAVGALLFGKHGPTKAERAADSTLATVPAWKDSLAQRDSLVALADSSKLVLQKRSREQAKIAALAKHRADSLQALVNLTLSAGSASDSVRQLLGTVDAQKKASAQFRIAMGSLAEQHWLDSLSLHEADSTLAVERGWRVQDQKRIDRLTKDLSDLRNERKGGKFRVPLLGLSLPKPPKWAMASIGCLAGGYVGAKTARPGNEERSRAIGMGCASGAAALTVMVPTD